MGIEKPKIFISYRWTDDNYISKVVGFANRLLDDGIDVVLDQFQMKLGNDMNNFMEKCVYDSSITNVLILLSPDYKTKADSRIGGTGTETQIISNEVYSNVENTKFIPIIFEKRGEEPDACIPTYLKQRRWLDMSEDSDFEKQYIELVRTLYGKDKYMKAPLGSKPAWVDDNTSVNKNEQIIINSYRNIRKEYDDERAVFVSFDLIKNALKEIKEKFYKLDTLKINEFEKYYKPFDEIKMPYLSLLEEIKFDKLVGKKLYNFFNDLLKITKEGENDFYIFKTLFKILIHEIFIETVALLWNARNFEAINYLTSTPYIEYFGYRSGLSNFKDIFYSKNNREVSELCKKLGVYLHKDGENGMSYYSGIAEYWMRNIPIKYLNKTDFANADCLLTNISMVLTGELWFAISYIYLNDYESETIREISISLKSRKLAKDYHQLFDMDDKELKEALIKMKEYYSKYEIYLGYRGIFGTIPLITNYLEIDDFETIK